MTRRRPPGIRRATRAELPRVGTMVTAHNATGTIVAHGDVLTCSRDNEPVVGSAGVVVEWPAHGPGWRTVEHPDDVRVAA